jgi:hypothetical protein
MRIKYIPIGMLLLSLTLLCSVTQYGQVSKYPALSGNKVVLKGDSGKWDFNKVHTLSVVEANMDGYKYWGYYGLSYYGGNPNLRKAGLVRSNDLVHWDKYQGNPIIKGDCRWPTIVLVNSVFYMFYAEYDANNYSRIVMVTSKHGIVFDNKVVVVSREKGKQNQNPFIYFNKQDGYFYLTYYHGVESSNEKSKNIWQIKLRKSKDINNLEEASSKTLLTSNQTIAAPSITFFNNKYYLLIESIKDVKWGNKNKWVTLAYESNKADGKYKNLSNNPVLFDNDACAFQYVFDNQLYVFYSHCFDMTDITNSNWELRMVKAVK